MTSDEEDVEKEEPLQTGDKISPTANRKRSSTSTSSGRRSPPTKRRRKMKRFTNIFITINMNAK